jgi:spoIIIJ-associated protein
MNTTVEYEGKSVENALENASRDMKIPKEKLQYDVISHGSTGIFGSVGVKKAKIRITLSQGQGKSGESAGSGHKVSALSLVDEAFGSMNASVQEKKTKNGDKVSGRAQGKAKADNRKPAAVPEEGRKPVAQAQATLPTKQEKAAVQAVQDPKGEEASPRQEIIKPGRKEAEAQPSKAAALETETADEKTTKPASRSRSRSSRSRNGRGGSSRGRKPSGVREEKTQAAQQAKQDYEAPSVAGPDEDHEVPDGDDGGFDGFLDVEENGSENQPPAEVTPEMVARGREVLEKILAHISEDVTIREEVSPGRILYNLDGGNPAIIIGKRGQTLEAIQYVVDKIVNRDAEGRIRVQMDVEGYIETRKEHLQQLALKQAEKARRTGKPATIGQMNAHDRRIIHLALKDDRAVRTQSVGEGYYRRLVIFPKKVRRRRGDGNGSEDA